MKKFTKVSQAHDRAFRAAMSDIRVAKDFFSHHLSPELLAKIQLDSLELRKESFIDPELQLAIVDILYSVSFCETNQSDSQVGYLYLLAEQQTKADKLMAWRIIKYTCRIIEQHLAETNSETLPIVWPIVFYNGKLKYPYAKNIFACFGEHEALARQIMFQSFQLVDIGQIPDEAIREHRWSALLELLMKHIHARDMLNYLQAWSDLFQALVQEQADVYIYSMLKYAAEKAEISDRQAFINWIAKNLEKPLGGKVMTLAEQWQAEGYQRGIEQRIEQGIQKGLVEGLHQGERQGEATLFLRLLKHKFSVVPERYIACVEQADEEILLGWSERIIEAKTLEDIFGE